MHSSLDAPYTNEISREALCHLDDLYLEQRHLEGYGEEVAAFVNRQKAFVQAHPPIAIYRVATEGSQTRYGGTIQQVSSSLTFTLDNGWKVCAAQKGDQVVYADGSTARIITGAGQANSNIALVGSRLSNGDEIINTLQKRFLIIVREGVPMAEDFLPALKLADVHRLHSNGMKEDIQ
ncbi:PAAR domain-containing protein [Pseudomonas sp. Pdm06]|uniref:PAAR domain-containing protein n=1 Tax=Pseudomonas sp. Pdm06 TaxID=1790044 RepID=UPI00177ABCE5|nr:PAAR domain-containing protein [Pseudomonas sp. Pdm06]MBD9464820.1 PAAR domain-containing protein [Pseudomonas sp. Pdm06]